jgi:deoxyribonuclease V
MFQAKIIPQSLLTDGAILAVDVDYRETENKAVVAGVLFQDWSSTECAVISFVMDGVAPYEPGQFYKRELPCILEMLKHVTVKLGCIVVDGYVYLGHDQHDGLGAKLFHETQIPVIGVAKTHFDGTPAEAFVTRNGSIKPLFVTAIGGDEEKARLCIRTMAGDFRIPGMLKYVDHCCRTAFSSVQPASSVV